jgi:dTDP-4-amino-4,6-dideoxygalactose transaminase
MNPHLVTEQFESALATYTGAKFAITIDNCSNALFLCLKYLYKESIEITIPSHTYMSVPCSIINAGHKVKFKKSDKLLTGAYQLDPTPVWDSALRLTRNMYQKGQYMCLSFSGPKKILKLGKGGAILTDDPKAAAWFRKARYNGRSTVNHLIDSFSMLGWNFYMANDVSARGLILLMGLEDEIKDVTQEYQDLSQYSIYHENK